MKVFFVYRNKKNRKSDEIYNPVSEKICDFSYNANFDSSDPSVDGMVCILQKKT